MTPHLQDQTDLCKKHIIRLVLFIYTLIYTLILPPFLAYAIILIISL